ncbi:MAG: DUF1735 domain-containing protein [Alistipes sp.]|nr:DUF1735 domain-containing protein [Alistipes sp.]
MKTSIIIRKWLRAAGFGLLAAGAVMLTACDDPEFVRDTGQMPAEAGKTPSGALYAVGSFEPQLQDFCISEDTQIDVVYRLDYPAPSDVTVTLALGAQDDVDAINDARGLKDGNTGIPMVPAPYKRYKLLPESNYELPVSLTLTVPKGKTESAPLTFKVVYDDNLLPSEEYNYGKRMLWPWMLPLCVEKVEGEVIPLVGQILGIGIRPANSWGSAQEMITWGEITLADLKPKEEDFTFITYCDCREFDPSCAALYYYAKADYNLVEQPWGAYAEYKEGTARFSPMFDVEIMHPAFLVADAESGMPVIQPSTDLLYVLTHQERYADPQRKLWMKICVSLETERKSPLGLCNLSDEARASLVWQIKNLLETYKLDGIAFNDAPADYTVAGAPAVDKASYTKFLKELRTALGADKLIMVSYDADENSALYEAHDGVRAGECIDFAWWGTTNEFCTPYDTAPTVQPIAGLDAKKFSPVLADAVDTPAYKALWVDSDPETFIPNGVGKAQELNDKGQCSVLVYKTLRANIQGFYEGAFWNIPWECFGRVPLHEGDGMSTGGWSSQGGVFEKDLRYPAHFAGYGGGLKTW